MEAIDQARVTSTDTHSGTHGLDVHMIKCGDFLDNYNRADRKMPSFDFEVQEYVCTSQVIHNGAIILVSNPWHHRAYVDMDIWVEALDSFPRQREVVFLYLDLPFRCQLHRTRLPTRNKYRIAAVRDFN